MDARFMDDKSWAQYVREEKARLDEQFRRENAIAQGKAKAKAEGWDEGFAEVWAQGWLEGWHKA